MLFSLLLGGCTRSGNTTTTEAHVEDAPEIYTYVFDGRVYTELPDSNKPEDNIFTSRVTFTPELVNIQSLGTPLIAYGLQVKCSLYLVGCESTYEWHYDSNSLDKTYLQFQGDIYESGSKINLNFKFTNIKYKTYKGIKTYGVQMDCIISSGDAIINPSTVTKNLFSRI